jgi:hypothetical protein
MTTVEEIANATVMVQCGGEKGSGFQFISPNTILTNAHVVEESIKNSRQIRVQTEEGATSSANLLDFSPKSKYDYAVLKTRESDSNKKALQPSERAPKRGTEVYFAGFPHGVDDLLVHTAMVSGPSEHGFYIDGSANGGNSGGPVVDTESGKVVGLVTQRRFLGEVDMEEVTREMSALRGHFQNMGGSAGIVISGVDFGELASLMADSFSVMSAVVDANASTGIGIAHSIDHVVDGVDFSQLDG